MDKEDFIRRKRAAETSLKRLNQIWMPIFILILVANIPLNKYFANHAYAGVYTGGFVGFLIANMVFVLWFIWSRADKFGLRCPHCQKALTPSAAEVAEATGKCGHCGNALWTEDGQACGPVGGQ
jgi:hypothetical protein